MGRGHSVICVRCEEAVATKRGGWRLFGGLLMIVSLFAWWPLAVIGLLMLIMGGSAKKCARCGSDDLVPPDSLRGRRIVEGRRE